jgi:transcriptional regulator with XRE-family HTH domain
MKERIEKIMEMEQLSASKFADAIGVQRSGISHILSGRNKPSLELINKILEHFEQLNADWLLLGKGEMLQKENTGTVKGSGYSFESNNTEAVVDPRQPGIKPVRIVVFYSDNSFEEYVPRSKN